jgi:hypothetical protein
MTNKKHFWTVLIAIVGAFFAGLYVAGGDTKNLVMFVVDMSLIAVIIGFLAFCGYLFYTMIKG